MLFRSAHPRFGNRSSHRPVQYGMEMLERRTLMAVDLSGTLTLPVGVVTPGQIATGSFTLTNTGDTPAGPFDIQIVLSTDETFGNADDLTVATVNIPGFPANDSEVQDAQAPVPPLIASGAYFVAV